MFIRSVVPMGGRFGGRVSRRRAANSFFVSVFLVLSLCVSAAVAFYLPGVAPTDYERGAKVELKVNKLDSVKTQLPYDYYSLPFCDPDGGAEYAGESLGEVLSQESIESSPFDLRMGFDDQCHLLCAHKPRKLTDDELAAFAEKIDKEYRVHYIVDNLPAATTVFEFKKVATDDGGALNTNEKFVRYEKGFALGFVGGDGVKYVNNHIRMNIQYHYEGPTDPIANGIANGQIDGTAPVVQTQHATTSSDSNLRVVGFEVEPFSVAHTVEQVPNAVGAGVGARPVFKVTTCPVTGAQPPQPVSGLAPDDPRRTVYWTYDVNWIKSDVQWASRWDIYLLMSDAQIHWFSIVNSIMIVLFLSGMVAVIMVRILHKDLARYNGLEQPLSEEEQQEETGWKLIHGDVFRTPVRAEWLCVFIGSGVQLFSMVCFTLLFAMLGFLSPANRGGLVSAFILLFVFGGTLAGYFATRLYKMFKLPTWRRITAYTALFLPGVFFVGFFILNLFVWGEKSSGAVPIRHFASLLLLWLGISLPLVYLGSYLAAQQDAIAHPVKINNLARVIAPTSAWYSSPYLSALLGGVLPFAAVFIEVYFIMTSVWLNQYYYVFPILFIVFLILIITSAEITIVLIYFQLCNENYQWWWKAFFTPATASVYLFLYSIMYFLTRLQITDAVPTILFFGYMLLASFAFALLTGTIGFVSTLLFVRKIYASVKVD